MTLVTIQTSRNGPLTQGDLVYTGGAVATVRDGRRTYVGRLVTAGLVALALAGTSQANSLTDYNNLTPAQRAQVDRANYTPGGLAAMTTHGLQLALRAVQRLHNVGLLTTHERNVRVRKISDAYAARQRREAITSQGWSPSACSACAGTRDRP